MLKYHHFRLMENRASKYSSWLRKFHKRNDSRLAFIFANGQRHAFLMECSSRRYSFHGSFGLPNERQISVSVAMQNISSKSELECVIAPAPDFLNTAAIVKISFSPEEILPFMKEVNLILWYRVHPDLKPPAMNTATIRSRFSGWFEWSNVLIWCFRAQLWVCMIPKKTSIFAHLTYRYHGL